MTVIILLAFPDNWLDSCAILLNFVQQINPRPKRCQRRTTFHQLTIPARASWQPSPRVTNSEIQTSSSSMLCILCILPQCGVFCIFYVGLPNSKASRGLASVKPDPPHPQTSRHLQFKQQRTNWTILPWHAFLKSCLTCIVDSSRHDVCKDLGAHNTFLTSP